MPIRFDVTSLSIGELEKDLRAMGSRAPSILARAINRAGSAGKTAMVRAVADDTGFRQKTIEKEIRIVKASKTEPRFTMEIRGRRIPLIEFKARGPEPSRGRGRGVTWTNQGETKREPHAFIATMPTGHRGVFVRSRFTRGGARYSERFVDGRKRNVEIIKELFGPSIPQVFQRHIPVLEDAAQIALVKNLAHDIGFERSRQAAEPE